MSNSTEAINKRICENQKKIRTLYYGLKETFPEIFYGETPWIETLFLSYSNIVDMQFDGSELSPISLTDPLTGANTILASDGQVYTEEDIRGLLASAQHDRKPKSPLNPNVYIEEFSFNNENKRLYIPIREWQEAVIAHLEAVFPLKLRIEKTRNILDALYREIKKLEPGYAIQTDIPDNLTEEGQLEWQKEIIVILRRKLQSFLEDPILKAKYIADLRSHICHLDEPYYNSDIRNQSKLLYEQALSAVLSHKKPIENLGHQKYSISEIERYLTEGNENSFSKLFSNYGVQFINLHSQCSALVIELLESTRIELQQKEFAANKKEIDNLITQFKHIPMGYAEFIPGDEISAEDIQRQQAFLFELNEDVHKRIQKSEALINYYRVSIKKLSSDDDTSMSQRSLQANATVEEKKSFLDWQEEVLHTLEEAYPALLLEKAEGNNVEIHTLVSDIKSLVPNYIPSDPININIPADIDISFIEVQEKKIMLLKAEKESFIDQQKIEENNKQISELQKDIGLAGIDYTHFSPAADLSLKALISEQEKHIANLIEKCKHHLQKEYDAQVKAASDLHHKIWCFQPGVQLERMPHVYPSQTITLTSINTLKEHVFYLQTKYLECLQIKNKQLATQITILENRLTTLKLEAALRSKSKEKEKEAASSSAEEILHAIAEKEKYINTLNSQLSDFASKHPAEFTEYYLWKAHTHRLRNEFEHFNQYKRETPDFNRRCALYTRMLVLQQEQYDFFRQEHAEIIAALDEQRPNLDPALLKQIQEDLDKITTPDTLKYKKLFDEKNTLEGQKATCTDKQGKVLQGRSQELDRIEAALCENQKRRFALDRKYPYFSIRHYAEMLSMIDSSVETLSKISESAPAKMHNKDKASRSSSSDEEEFSRCLEQKCNGRSVLVPERIIQQEAIKKSQLKIASVLEEMIELNSHAEYDGSFNIKLHGDSGVGKSSLILRIADDIFTDRFISPLRADFKSVCRQYRGKKIRLQLWEQSREFNIYGPTCLSPAIVLLCFDLTDRISFENVNKHFKDFERCFPQAAVILVGTKSDLAHERNVSGEEARALAEAQGWAYFETSAKESIHCEELLAYSVLTCLNPVRKIQEQLASAPPQNSGGFFAANASVPRASRSTSSNSSSSSRSSSSSDTSIFSRFSNMFK